MKIIRDFPPNILDIEAVFKLGGNEIFCYGDTIYNPKGFELPPWLIAHEEVHRLQQGGDPDAWWERYLRDPEFRFDQELPAYVVEYKCFCSHDGHGRNQRRAKLTQIAKQLASPTYGGMVTTKQARKRLKQSV